MGRSSLWSIFLVASPKNLGICEATKDSSYASSNKSKKKAAFVGCIWRSLRIGTAFAQPSNVIGLQMLLRRMQTLNGDKGSLTTLQTLTLWNCGYTGSSFVSWLHRVAFDKLAAWVFSLIRSLFLKGPKAQLCFVSDWIQMSIVFLFIVTYCLCWVSGPSGLIAADSDHLSTVWKERLLIVKWRQHGQSDCEGALLWGLKRGGLMAPSSAWFCPWHTADLIRAARHSGLLRPCRGFFDAPVLFELREALSSLQPSWVISKGHRSTRLPASGWEFCFTLL